MGQLIPCPFLAVRILNAGDHQFLHDPFDQGGLTGAHRAHHSNVDITAGTRGNIGVNVFHSLPPENSKVGTGYAPGKTKRTRRCRGTLQRRVVLTMTASDAC